MKPILAFGSVLLCVSSLIGGDADKDRKALQGKWEGPLKDDIVLEFTVSGKEWTMQIKGRDDLKLKGTYTLDAKASPSTLDLKIVEADGDVEKFKGTSSLCIYEVTADSIRLCASEPGREKRPADFQTREGQVLIEFKRVK